MKKHLLFIAFTGLFGFISEAQSCTPGANFIDSTYGVWPDTVQNFPPAAANVAYSTDLNFKVPATVTAELDASGNFVGSPIQSFTVTGVQGLPAGYNYACNIANCTYNGGNNGCANVYGTTATTGTYPITIDVDATVLVTLIPGLPPTPVTQSVSFEGYKIIVGNAGIVSISFDAVSLFPNPAQDAITLSGVQAKTIILSNLNGQVLVEMEDLASSEVTLNISSFDKGIYFVSVVGLDGVVSKKFIKE
ncbi:MAG: T9SS type A sorting domain-containing protein [Flavobacteriales bacterium]